jgi:general secretion pathway protein L
LEETVIGDVDRFHFALGPLDNGKTSVAYLEKAWLEDVFAQLGECGVEVTQCWSAPLTLPFESFTAVAENTESDCWTLQMQGGVVMVRYAAQLGFSVDQEHASLALQLLLTAQKRVDQLPSIALRAASAAELQHLTELLPVVLQPQVIASEQVGLWQRDYSGSSINLCQGEFSQRLPIERWWRSWRGVAMLAAACFAVHISILLYQIYDFRHQNLVIRQQIEAAYRHVVPQGALVDAERQLSGLVRELQPAGQVGSVTNMLAKVLPAVAAQGAITLRNVQYLGDSGEMNLQLQSSEYDAIESLRAELEATGLRAELLGSSAQGQTHSARLKISQPNR